MATHKSAEKRHRQNLKRRAQNRTVRATLRTTIKEVQTLLSKKEITEAQQLLRTAVKMLDKAATHGVIHRKNAQRNISRLSKKVSLANRT